MPIRQEVADTLTGQWQTGLCEAPCKAPVSFCYACCCVCCMAGQQRLQILDVIGEDYVCCGGLFPCGPFGQPQDRSCAWVEACCCPSLAVSGNRFLIQTRFDRQNTACDDFLLWMACLAPYIVCCCELAGVDVPQEVENCVDCMNNTVLSCMLAQQQVEIDHVKKTGFCGPSPAIIAMLPPHQQQMITKATPPMGAAAAAAGAVLGGAAGAGAMYSAAQGPRQQPQAAPLPHLMGHAHRQQQCPEMYAPVAEKIPPAGPVRQGFMSTVAPNGMPWWQYCQGRQVSIDPASGQLQGPWGHCLAWAKVFEVQNPGWKADPHYAEDGPCGQVVEAATAAAPFHLRTATRDAAQRLEDACDAAVAAGAPLPAIGQRALA